MGLDTSHDCWHGSYGSFHRFRAELVWWAWGDPKDHHRGNIMNYPGYWSDPVSYRHSEATSPKPLEYPEGDALVTLIHHSDCDGEIAPEDCGPLADRLEELLAKVPERAMYDSIRPATERFVAGLRKAAASGEAVEFY